MSVTPLMRYHLMGKAFSAHICGAGCSCDPCTCDPCSCGDGRASDQPLEQQWLITGYFITSGQVQQVDVSDLTLVRLALTSGEGTNDDWQEYLLLEKSANVAQRASLLELIQANLLPDLVSSINSSPQIYLAPLVYRQREADRARLEVDFTEAERVLISGNGSEVAREWTYKRHVALQHTFDFAQ